MQHSLCRKTLGHSCVEVCLLEVMCRGSCCLFTFVTEKTAKRVQVKHVDLGSLQGNPPCARGSRCCPKISRLLCQPHHCRLSAWCNTRAQLCGFRAWQSSAHAELTEIVGFRGPDRDWASLGLTHFYLWIKVKSRIREMPQKKKSGWFSYHVLLML